MIVMHEHRPQGRCDTVQGTKLPWWTKGSLILSRLHQESSLPRHWEVSRSCCCTHICFDFCTDL